MKAWTRAARGRMARTALGLVTALAVATVAMGLGAGSAEAAPTPNAGGPYHGVAGQLIQFGAAATVDGLSFFWDFGDGTTAVGVAPLKAYAAAGFYPVTLTVTDSFGVSAVTATTATIRSAFALTTGWYTGGWSPWTVGAGQWCDPSDLATSTVPATLYPTGATTILYAPGCPTGLAAVVNGTLACVAVPAGTPATADVGVQVRIQR